MQIRKDRYRLGDPGRLHRAFLKKLRIGIIVSEWNKKITGALLQGARKVLLQYGIAEWNIKVSYVPGSFELPFGAVQMGKAKLIDGVICLGCIIQGETRHWEFISQAVAWGIMEAGFRLNKPVAFGVLTTDNVKQAKDRAGGKFGNKGEEAAMTVIKMLLNRTLRYKDIRV